jgi:hypothetical protein
MDALGSASADMVFLPRSSRRSNHEARKKPCRRVSSPNGVRIGPACLIRTREDISVNSRKWHLAGCNIVRRRLILSSSFEHTIECVS